MNKTKKPVKVKPLLRYPGGKTYLLPGLRKILGFTKIDLSELTYCEPMVGGGAVFFSEQHRFKRSVISDLDEDVMSVYKAARDHVEELIKELSKKRYIFRGKEDEESFTNYYKIRAEWPTDTVKRAARYRYLSLAGFNGRMGKNKDGSFNNMIGKKQEKSICYPELFRVVSAALQGTRIICIDAPKLIQRLKNPSLLFVDPPYHSDKNKKFVGFSGGKRFDDEEQERLIKAMLSSGQKFIYTNRSTKLMLKLFKGEARLFTKPLKHSIVPERTNKLVGEMELIATNVL